MWAIENGKTKNIKATTLVNLSLALGVTMQELTKSRLPKSESERTAVELISTYEALQDNHRAVLLAAAKAMLAAQKK